MNIKNLKLKNYRNYKEIEINFDKETNIIYGNNAEGKTNLLEAIYISSTSKSHKNSKEIDIIKFNENEAHIKLEFNKNDKLNTIDIQLNKDQKKGIAYNGEKVEKLSDFLGNFNVIMFAPEDLNIIKEGPQIRRKFLDMELCQIDKVYINYLSSYNKALNQRNAMLKSNIDHTVLDSLDDQLITYGKFVIEKRRKNIEELKPKILNIHSLISGDKEKLIIDYESNAEKDFENNLKANRNIDIKNQFTSIGPHRDDISFVINGEDIRKFGSQGQKKTAAISLKLSELNIIKEKNGDTPVLLLDDVFSELDETRQKLLIQNLKGIQTIITCTGMKKNIFELLKPTKVFKVENGNIR